MLDDISKALNRLANADTISAMGKALNRLASVAEAQQSDARDVLEIENPDLRRIREARELAYRKAIEEDNAKYWAEVDAREAKKDEEQSAALKAEELLDRDARERSYLEEKAQAREEKFWRVLMLGAIFTLFTLAFVSKKFGW